MTYESQWVHFTTLYLFKMKNVPTTAITVKTTRIDAILVFTLHTTANSNKKYKVTANPIRRIRRLKKSMIYILLIINKIFYLYIYIFLYSY